jgi:uncharacterized protein YkwD
MRRHLSILFVIAAAALCLPAGAFAACPGAETQPNAENLDQIAATTLCLLNDQRAEKGLPALKAQAELEQASIDYSELMVDQQFFAHVSPAGSVLTQRLTDSGYLGGEGAWIVGENIAWGESYLGTPGAIVTAWMNSPGHRENILSSDYDEIGVGIAIGVPSSANDGATYTTDFGHRDAADDDTVAGSDEDSSATGGEPADTTATVTRPGSTRRATAVRKAPKRVAPKAKAKVKAQTSCKAVAHRAAARQTPRARCLAALKRRARHR